MAIVRPLIKLPIEKWTDILIADRTIRLFRSTRAFKTGPELGSPSERIAATSHCKFSTQGQIVFSS